MMLKWSWFCLLWGLQLAAAEHIRLQDDNTTDSARDKPGRHLHPYSPKGIVEAVDFPHDAHSNKKAPEPTKMVAARAPANAPPSNLDPTQIWSDPNNVFSPAGPIFINFSPNSLNMVKTAFLEVIKLADLGLSHASRRTPTFYRCFKEADRQLVMKVFEHIRGSGNGPDAIRDPSKPLRVVYYFNTFVGGPVDDNPCDVPFRLAVFYPNAPDNKGPAMQLCGPMWTLSRRALTDWDSLDCANIPEAMSEQFYTKPYNVA